MAEHLDQAKTSSESADLKLILEPVGFGSSKDIGHAYDEAVTHLMGRIDKDPYLEAAEKEQVKMVVNETLKAMLAPISAQLQELEVSKTEATLQRIAELQRTATDLVHSLEKEVDHRLLEASDGYVIVDSEFTGEVRDPLSALTALIKDRESSPELTSRYLKVYTALETAVPDEKTRLEWTDVIVSSTQAKNRSYLAMVLTIIQDESGFSSRPWRDQAEIWANDAGVGDAPSTYGPFQLHLDTAREIATARGEYTNDEALIKTLETDKKTAMAYFLIQLDKITRLYTSDKKTPIASETFTYIRADYLSGLYSSKNSALQKGLVVLGYLPATYTPEGSYMEQSSIDSDIGPSCLKAMVKFASDHSVLDEKNEAYTVDSLQARYFGRYSNRLAFDSSPLAGALAREYKIKTGQEIPKAYVTERKTKGGLYSTAASVSRSAVIFDEYCRKII